MSAVQVQIGEIKDGCISADIAVSDGRTTREYFIFLGRDYVSVVNDPNNTKRGRSTRLSVGKTFHDWNEEFVSVAAHYKRDGAAIVEVIKEMRRVRMDAKWQEMAFAGPRGYSS